MQVDDVKDEILKLDDLLYDNERSIAIRRHGEIFVIDPFSTTPPHRYGDGDNAVHDPLQLVVKRDGSPREVYKEISIVERESPGAMEVDLPSSAARAISLMYPGLDTSYSEWAEWLVCANEIKVFPVDIRTLRQVDTHWRLNAKQAVTKTNKINKATGADTVGSDFSPKDCHTFIATLMPNTNNNKDEVDFKAMSEYIGYRLGVPSENVVMYANPNHPNESVKTNFVFDHNYGGSSSLAIPKVESDKKYNSDSERATSSVYYQISPFTAGTIEQYPTENSFNLRPERKLNLQVSLREFFGGLLLYTAGVSCMH